MELSIRLKRLPFSMTFLSKLCCIGRRVWPWPSSSALKKGGGKSFITHLSFLLNKERARERPGHGHSSSSSQKGQGKSRVWPWPSSPCRLDDGETSSQCWRHLLGIQSESSKVVEEINTIVPRNCCPEELLQLYSVGPRAAETNSSGRVFF